MNTENSAEHPAASKLSILRANRFSTFVMICSLVGPSILLSSTGVCLTTLTTIAGSEAFSRLLHTVTVPDMLVTREKFLYTSFMNFTRSIVEGQLKSWYERIASRRRCVNVSRLFD